MSTLFYIGALAGWIAVGFYVAAMCLPKVDHTMLGKLLKWLDVLPSPSNVILKFMAGFMLAIAVVILLLSWGAVWPLSIPIERFVYWWRRRA
ncbi:MAG: hypothetical protein WCW16_00895 [Candidatus Magasanikbacteria bacterium]